MQRSFAILGLLALGLAACREQTAPAPASLAQSTRAPASAALDESSPLSPKPPPDPRQVALAAELDAYDEVLLRHDATALPEPERAMLRALRDAAAVVEELYSLQLHPRSLEWRDLARASGTAVEQRLLARNRVPWCEDTKEPACSAVAEAVHRRVGDGLWPGPPMAKEELALLSRQINALELLSPFTVVRGDKAGGFEATSYARCELLGPKLARLADLLDQAAAHAPSPSLALFLRSRALSLRADEPFPYDASDLDWIAVDGDYEVTVGPYETYDDPHQIKAMFQIVIGRRVPSMDEEIARVVSTLKERSEALAAWLGEPLLPLGETRSSPVMRAVDAWIVAGEARRARGALAAYHLPNRGLALDRGRSKKVILVNHIEALAAGLSHTARGALGEAAAARVTEAAATSNALYHELGHGLGPGPTSRVAGAPGKDITVQAALGEDSLAIEELKAMVLGLWLAEMDTASGALGEDELLDRRVTAVASALERLTFPPTDPHSRAAAALLAWLVQGRALIHFDEGPPLGLAPKEFRLAVESLARSVLTGLIRADAKALRSLLVESAGLRALAKRAQAGKRPATLAYDITGL